MISFRLAIALPACLIALALVGPSKTACGDVTNARQDAGGIYTLGNMPGTMIRGNHIHDNRGGPGGIYLDEGSGFIEVTGNVVYGVPRPMNYNNRVQNRIATCNEHDNFFGKIDEVRLYDRAFSANEVRKNATATGSADSQNQIVTDGLVGHWGFEDTPTPPSEIQAVIDKAGPTPPYRDLLERGTE